MAFRIRNNYEADVALTNLNVNRTKLSKLEQQLATGLRIVRASDDATDLFIADNLKQTYVGFERGTQNAQYGLSFARIADDALGKIYDILVKIKDKAVEASNAHTKTERQQAQQQINEYLRNIEQIVQTTEFDGFKPLAGDSYIVHFGSHKDQYIILNGNQDDPELKGTEIVAKAGSTDSTPGLFYFTGKGLTALADKVVGYDGLEQKPYYVQFESEYWELNVLTASKARETIANVETIMKSIDAVRGYWAGVENQLENIIENNKVLVDNLKEGESVVRNIDYASAMAEFQKMRVITQANIASLAQANQIPQLVMQLLR